MRRTRFVMIGGFLGAGKTTVLARLARDAMARGLRVGLVTNDQSHGLVDTESLRANGFHVGEVPGACFCCKFDDLLETIAELGDQQPPDLILAEPVGSCTDLVATVIEPLRQHHGDRFDVGPLAVLLKPEHGGKILREEQGGFSPKAAYIFLKQIEEADIVVLNKIDKLSTTEASELVSRVEQRFPRKQVISMSARSGEGWEAFASALDEELRTPRATMDVNYDIYAEGEAELGWLNGRGTVTKSGGQFSLDAFALDVARRLARRCDEYGVEPAHLKVLVIDGRTPAVANVVAAGQGAELSQTSSMASSSATWLVNARVATDPTWLVEAVTSELARAAHHLDVETTITNVQHLRPGRPVPTHRLESNPAGG